MLNQISEQQANKVVAINENFEAVLPAGLFGINRSLSVGLLFAWYGGVIWNGSAYATIADGTIALSGSTTNYIEADSAGVVYQNTSAFTAGRTPLYALVTSSTGITTVTDYRIANPAYAGGLGNFKHVTIGSGTITASAPALQMTQTWNNAGVAFVGADMNITDTASDAASILQRWRVGGSVMASISKAGALLLAAGATLGGILALPAGAVGAPAVHFGDATTGLYRSAADQIGVAAGGANVGIFSSSGLQVTGLNNTGSTTLGDASGDTLTVNAGTITYGANWTATRAAGALATGVQNIQTWNVTYSGDAGGATNARAVFLSSTFSGTNSLSIGRGIYATASFSATAGSVSTGYAIDAAIALTSSGNASTLSGVNSSVSVTGSGGTTTANGFLVSVPSMTGAGTIGTLNGFKVLNIGNALITNAIGIKVDDFTNSTNMRGVQLSLTSGTGKHNLYIDGTAQNYFAGNLGIGTTSVTDRILGISKNITGATTAYGTFTNSVIQSDVTSVAYLNRAQIQTVAAAFTCGLAVAYGAAQGTIGATSAITQQIGFYADSSLVGAVSNYGFYGAIAAATNRWNIYMVGTAQNYFAGSTGVGIAVPISKFHVYEDNTGTNNANGITIEQDGTGDSLLHFLLTGSQRWTMGIDNSGSDAFKIGTNQDLGSNNALTILTTGQVLIGTTTHDTVSLLQVNGAIAFGTHSAIGAETVTGFITIKDSGGTDRKLAVLS